VRAPLRLWLEQLELWVHLDLFTFLVVDKLDPIRQPFLNVSVVYLAISISGTLRPYHVGRVIIKL
jgi:hypothetical protein